MMRNFSRHRALEIGVHDAGVRILLLGAVTVFCLVLISTTWVLFTTLVYRPLPHTLVEKQIAMLSTVVEEKPKVAKGWADLARAYMAARDYAAAAKVLEEGSGKAGENAPEILLEKGRLASLQNRPEQALKLLEQARMSASRIRGKELRRLSDESVHPDPRVIKGETIEIAAILEGDLYARAKKWNQALAMYDLAISENSNTADVFFKRGSVNLELARWEEAAADFRQAIAFNPQLLAAHRGLERAELEIER